MDKQIINDFFSRYGEPALKMASGIVAEPVAGWAGIMSGGDAGVIQRTREAMTYEPRTDAGKAGQRSLEGAIQTAKKVLIDDNPPVRNALDYYDVLSDKIGDSSPVLGAAMRTLPAAALALVGPGGTATRAAFSNVARGTSTGLVRGAQAAAENAMSGSALRGPLAGQDGMFAGHLSKTADLGALDKAKSLKADGLSDQGMQKSESSTTSKLRANFENAEPFSDASSNAIEKLQSSVLGDVNKSLDSGNMPVFRVTDHVVAAIHPSAQNPGKFQVTRYSKRGVMGDSQYNSVEDAVHQELWNHPIMSESDAGDFIGKSLNGEQEYNAMRMAQ